MARRELSSPQRPPPHIVVVGGGVAGMTLATRLGHRLGRRALARITLIDRSWVHVWKPMLHTFAAGTWNIHEQQVQYVHHARTHHFEYVPGQVNSIDRAARRIRLAPLQAAGELVAGTRELDYEVLILAFGSRANDFGTQGVVEHCHFIDSHDQADAFNARVRAHVVRSFAQGGGDIGIGIVGGGATGVELAAELSRMVDLATAYGGGDTRPRLRVTLLESGPRILGAFPEEVSVAAAAQLRALDVDVRTGATVVAADPDGYVLDGGERVAAALKVWAAGIRASDNFADSGLKLNRGGQVVVGRNLLAQGEQHIFALGDCASLVPEGADRALPPTAQVANQQALHLVRHLPAWLFEGDSVPPFRFRDLGALVALSEYNAFGWLGRIGFFKGGFIKGWFALLNHALLYRRHQLSLHGPLRAVLLWIAESINGKVRPRIRIS
jgi:NADH dehydrogenase